MGVAPALTVSLPNFDNWSARRLSSRCSEMWQLLLWHLIQAFFYKGVWRCGAFSLFKYLLQNFLRVFGGVPPAITSSSAKQWQLRLSSSQINMSMSVWKCVCCLLYQLLLPQIWQLEHFAMLFTFEGWSTPVIQSGKRDYEEIQKCEYFSSGHNLWR